MAGQRCGYEGCKAWSKRGTAYCVVHPDGTRRGATGGAPVGNQNARKHGLYSGYVPITDLREALQAPPADLRLEIAVVRKVLDDLLSTGLPAVQLVKLVDKATGALVRMLRINKRLSGDDGRAWEKVVEQVLEEAGLGRS